VFTQQLVADIILAGQAPLWELALVDIDPVALDAAHRLVAKMLAARGVQMPVRATVDRREVLAGADFVVTTIAVGGRKSWQRDIDIPRRHGIYQPVGDTAMPGGISRAMRMIPQMIAIARDVADLCPDAYFFNYSNPMTAICRAIRKETGVPVVGLCHGIHHVEGVIARFLDEPAGDLTSFGIGLNHLTFLTRLRLRGADAVPLIQARLDDQEAGLAQELSTRTHWPNSVSGTPRWADDPFTWGLFRQYSVFPCVMDRHTVEFYPERFAGGAYHGQRLGQEAFPIDACIAEGDKAYHDMIAFAHAPDPLPENYFDSLSGESEQLVAIMTDLLQDGRGIFSVNLPNTGQAPYLPKDAVLEGNACAMAGGFAALQADSLPAALVAKLTAKIQAIEITVDAAIAGSRDMMVEALLADGTVGQPDAAARLADELIAGHREHLPQFA